MRTNKTLLVISTLLVGSSMMFAGTVSGKVTYTGTPAHQKPIDMSKEPSCAKQHATPITTETVVTGPSNALENVVVYISSGAPDDGQVPSQAITFEQKGCQYIPHVLAMHVNQELRSLIATRRRTTSTRCPRCRKSGTNLERPARSEHLQNTTLESLSL